MTFRHFWSRLFLKLWDEILSVQADTVSWLDEVCENIKLSNKPDMLPQKASSFCFAVSVVNKSHSELYHGFCFWLCTVKVYITYWSVRCSVIWCMTDISFSKNIFKKILPSLAVKVSPSHLCHSVMLPVKSPGRLRLITALRKIWNVTGLIEILLSVLLLNVQPVKSLEVTEASKTSPFHGSKLDTTTAYDTFPMSSFQASVTMVCRPHSMGIYWGAWRVTVYTKHIWMGVFSLTSTSATAYKSS